MRREAHPTALIAGRAAVLTPGAARLEVLDVVFGPPGPGEALVEIAGCGVCHTDIAMIEGARPGGSFTGPIVLGHEGSGRILAVGVGVPDLEVGDAVVLSFRSCAGCVSCRTDHPAYCETFLDLNFSGHRRGAQTSLWCEGAPVLNGFFGQSSFATHALVRADQAVRVEAGDDLVTLGPLGCGLQTGAGAVLNILKPAPGASLAVIGAGAVGMAALMAAQIAGCGVRIAVDLNPERLSLARELGATHVLQAPIPDLAEAIQAISSGGVDVSLDTTARPDMVAQAFAALRSGGRAAYVGIRGAELTLPSAPFMRRCTLHGVMEGDSRPPVFIPELLAHHRAGRFPFERLVRLYDFKEIDRALADMRAGAVIKPVLRVGEPSRPRRAGSVGQALANPVDDLMGLRSDEAGLAQQ
jgi:aryl-alcohol dehydrogenase